MTTNAALVFEEKAEHEKGFAAHFDAHVKPRLLELEEARLAARRALWVRIAITTGVVVLGAGILYLVYPWRADIFWWGLAIWLAAVAFLVWLARRAPRGFARDRKRALIPSVLSFFGEFEYDPRGRISKRVLRNSHLFDDWDDYDSEDLVSGTHGGRTFEFAEASLARKGGEDDRVRFRGYIMALELPDKAGGVTIGLSPNGGSFTDMEEVVKRARDLTLVRFDDSEFADGFEVHSTHLDEARSLVSKTLVAALGRIGKLHQAEGVEFGINEQVFVLKIATDHDLFDPSSLFRSALSTDDTRRVLEEVYVVLAIVDELARGTRPGGG